MINSDINTLYYPMMELAEIYLGNITENPTLAERIERVCSLENCLEVYLNQTDSSKGRIYTHATSGVVVGIVKSREWTLREGDIFETQNGNLVLIHLQAQKVMVLSFTEPTSDRIIDLIHLGHVLGNHHWPIIVQKDKLYVQLAVEAEVIETTILNFGIPGLQIDYEMRSPQEQLNFSAHTHHDHHS